MWSEKPYRNAAARQGSINTPAPEFVPVEPVETHEPDGLDYGWVMQVTFVLTIVVGAPVVAALSVTTALPTWADRVEFAVRVGAVVYVVTAVAVYLYARRRTP